MIDEFAFGEVDGVESSVVAGLAEIDDGDDILFLLMTPFLFRLKYPMSA